MNIIFTGDIVGASARKAICEKLPELKREYSCSFCVANAENAAGGAGVTAKILSDFTPGLIDVFTGGDHTWDQKEFQNEISSLRSFLRPANFKAGQPGRGWGVFNSSEGAEIAVISLAGRVFMKDSFAECPFETADKILKEIPPSINKIIVDFHAEATSEKAALAHYLDGRVSAVLGTHTHVQTNDNKILAGGTAFISDVGMVGSEYSILGRDVKAVINKFTSGMPTRLEVAKGNTRIDAVVISLNEANGKAVDIKKLGIITEVTN
ncbi:MAG TPA: TIGR00282 family metallophosphoesterase [Victivallales bacterium]|nr:TIGR00282 family metallophosphoesterase [Victivallales bacterium]